MDKLKMLDRELTDLLNKYQAPLHDLLFEEKCELTDEETVNTQGYGGIYLIEIHSEQAHPSFEEWFDAFKSEWESKHTENKHTPSIIKKRSKLHKMKEEWIPLYIGKSKDIAKRVSEHINLDFKKPTYALKLKARGMLETRQFRLSTVCLEVDNYDIIAPILERALRNQLNPIVGKQ